MPKIINLNDLPTFDLPSILILFLAPLGALGAYWHWANYYFEDLGARGAFGDSFGAITAWFTGMAFFAMVTTLRQQLAQLDLQRKELELQRKELESATAVQRIQAAKMQEATHLTALCTLAAAYTQVSLTPRSTEAQMYSVPRESTLDKIRDYLTENGVDLSEIANPTDNLPLSEYHKKRKSIIQLKQPTYT